MKTTRTGKPVIIPIELKRALARSPKAKAAFDKFPPSHQREVIGYIVEAKKAETRERRAAKTVELLEKGWPKS
ncbi:MAG TPA: YdeI/OmpD-associated family protein [Candidatus Eisenbacteria bacterium]|nr:YdeI/OmpD-associated family protein [Candidatus Eisenbacteria bacterium]